MSQAPASRRTGSTQGSSRLVSSGGKSAPSAGGAVNGPERHPLKHDWSVSYVHRPPGTKVDYEKEIKRVATFGSIESFLHIYSHLTPPDKLQPVTDVLIFLARIPTPGTWECMPDGGKFTIRLVHPITPLIYESLLFALIGDQFDEDDRVVGCVLSARQQEDLISVWVEDEGDGLRSGALREKILSLLGLSLSSICEYRSNRALLEAASGATSTQPPSTGPTNPSNPSNRSTEDSASRSTYPRNQPRENGEDGEGKYGARTGGRGGYERRDGERETGRNGWSQAGVRSRDGA